MFRSAFRLVQTTARTVQVASRSQIKPFAVPVVRKFSDSALITPEEENAAFIAAFENKDMDAFDFKIAYMNLHSHDAVPEPAVIQAALYACRRLNHLPFAIRVLELVRIKCESRQDIYDYLMQELQPTLDDLGLKTVEGYGLHEVSEY
uniref:Cytochrome c oxidase subunit 5A, mitochondrial n=1 Tax=Phallusia mammillata TaxID=59560 RepID=A0A6F9DAI1_9ASCI|nr:cytochrome c oxidase subunit 5A, mitochondrial-like [Phallusia mammillata]